MGLDFSGTKEKQFYDKIIPVLEASFDGCYSCGRVWSAWNVGTMSPEDFIPFNRDDDTFNELLEFLKDALSKDDSVNVKNLLFDKCKEIRLDLYHNFYIETNFDQSYFIPILDNYDFFDEEWFGNVQEYIDDLKLLNIKKDETKVTKTRKLK